MSLATTSTPRLDFELGLVKVDAVWCLACGQDLGSMTLEQVTRALRWRGDLLCPDCRSRRCDYCGYIGVDELETRAHPDRDGLKVRKCYWCYEEERETPEYYFDSLREHGTHNSCLSSYRISQKTRSIEGAFQDGCPCGMAIPEGQLLTQKCECGITYYRDRTGQLNKKPTLVRGGGKRGK